MIAKEKTLKIKYILILITITFASCVPIIIGIDGDAPGTVTSIRYLNGDGIKNKYEIIVWFQSPSNHNTNLGHEIVLRYQDDPNYRIGDKIYFREEKNEEN